MFCRNREVSGDMANRLGVTIAELFDLAEQGTVVPISSLCTVFAESEVISMIGEGRSREDIAAGVVNSVAEKVAQLARRKQLPGDSASYGRIE